MLLNHRTHSALKLSIWKKICNLLKFIKHNHSTLISRNNAVGQIKDFFKSFRTNSRLCSFYGKGRFSISSNCHFYPQVLKQFTYAFEFKFDRGKILIDFRNI